MSEFPKLKWVDVDGRSVPFTYPQHEKEDGSFENTGENNNLPTYDKRVEQAVKDVQDALGDTPSDYPDSAVKAELESIKETQSQILQRLDGTFNTQVTGSNDELGVNLKSSELGKDNAVYTSAVEEYNLETLLDGEVIQPSESKNVQLNATNEKAVYLFISVDKPNWTLRGRTLFGRLNYETVFPVYNNHDKAYTSAEPALAFLLGIRPSAQGLPTPETLDEARSMRMPITNEEYVNFINNNVEESTFTVKVLRIW